MDLELVFSVSGLVAMVGLVFLLGSPLIPTWSDRVAGTIVPVLLSVGYVALALQPNDAGGGFGSLAEVGQLFTNEAALMAGWIHFLAFDLFVGAWICRTARQVGIRFWFVLPVLPVTFLFGPAGYLAFSGVRAVHAVRRG